MQFRSDEISIHLMPAGDKDKKDKEKEKQGNKGGHPGPQPEQARIGDPGGGGCGQTCTVGTGGRTPNRKKLSGGMTQGGLALLQSQLRSTLAPPPL